MKLSRKICDCAQSPIRKFYPYAVAAQQRGIRIHQLNIGQPDIQQPRIQKRGQRAQKHRPDPDHRAQVGHGPGRGHRDGSGGGHGDQG